jgi:hypothetical protein
MPDLPPFLFTFNVILAAASVILFSINFRQIRRFRRKLQDRAAEEEAVRAKNQELTAEVARVAALDLLLTQICAESFHRQTLPIWKAWAGTMGDIKVSADLRRYSPEEDE